MSSIDIESQDLDQFFCILSSNGERPVDVETFVVGCIKLKGVARAMDMVDCLINIRAVYDVQRELQARFQELQVLLGAPPEGPSDVPQPPERESNQNVIFTTMPFSSLAYMLTS